MFSSVRKMWWRSVTSVCLKTSTVLQTTRRSLTLPCRWSGWLWKPWATGECYLPLLVSMTSSLQTDVPPVRRLVVRRGAVGALLTGQESLPWHRARGPPHQTRGRVQDGETSLGSTGTLQRDESLLELRAGRETDLHGVGGQDERVPLCRCEGPVPGAQLSRGPAPGPVTQLQHAS